MNADQVYKRRSHLVARVKRNKYPGRKYPGPTDVWQAILAQFSLCVTLFPVFLKVPEAGITLLHSA